MAALLLILFYFLPSIVAVARKAPDSGSVIVINFLLGWTFIGWVISLAMSVRSKTSSSINVSVHQQLQPAYGYGMVANHPQQVTAAPQPDAQPQQLPAGQSYPQQIPAAPRLPQPQQADGQRRPQAATPSPEPGGAAARG